MSTEQALASGSRYDLRAGISPDAPDEGRLEDDEGAFGYCHSYETSSRYDGPGLRVVIFVSGCLLRCAYCHNPDTWHLKDGTYVSADQVLRRLGDFAPSIKTLNGGLDDLWRRADGTLAFTRRIFAGAKNMGLHTAIQTSGFLGDRADASYLSAVDLVLLDIKSFDPDTYRRVTGRELAPTPAFCRAPGFYLQASMGPVHARPGRDRRSCRRGVHGSIRRADEERRMGRGATLPPDGRLQVENHGYRIQAPEHFAARPRTGGASSRTVPCRRLPRQMRRWRIAKCLTLRATSSEASRY